MCAQGGDDIYYNICGEVVWRTDNGTGEDRHFLVHESQIHRLDYGLQAGSTPYALFTDPSALDFMAVGLAKGAPDVSLLNFKKESSEGGQLDFKHSLPARALWNAGDGLYVHRDKVGNTAWGYYTDNRTPIPLPAALWGARRQAAMETGRPEDPLDQQFIRRGYKIK